MRVIDPEDPLICVFQIRYDAWALICRCHRYVFGRLERKSKVPHAQRHSLPIITSKPPATVRACFASERFAEHPVRLGLRRSHADVRDLFRKGERQPAASTRRTPCARLCSLGCAQAPLRRRAWPRGRALPWPRLSSLRLAVHHRRSRTRRAAFGLPASAPLTCLQQPPTTCRVGGWSLCGGSRQEQRIAQCGFGRESILIGVTRTVNLLVTVLHIECLYYSK